MFKLRFSQILSAANFVVIGALSFLMSTVVLGSGVSSSSHTAYYGDVNGDSVNDIYLANTSEDNSLGSYKLLAQVSGYSQPILDDSIVVSSLQNGYYQIHDLELNGDGNKDIFIQSTTANRLGLTLGNKGVGSTPRILQTFANLDSNSHILTINDLNNDGRDDVSYQTTDQTIQLYADQQGHLKTEGLSQVNAFYGYDYLNKRRYKVVEEVGESRSEVVYIDENTELRDGELLKFITIGHHKVALSMQDAGEYLAAEIYLTDHLGSSSIALDHTASVVSLDVYDPFGSHQGFGSSSANSYKFTGKELDSESLLTYMHHRYYDAATNRFITPDPVFYAQERLINLQGWSPYSYGLNNPIVYIDPNGEIAKLAVTGGKIIYKAYKQYMKTGKVDAASLKKGGMDELVGIADDLNTLFVDGNKTFFEKLGAGVDLLTGLETTDGDIKELAGIVEVRKGKRSYQDDTKRTKYADGQVEEVWEAGRGRGGKVRDPNTGEVLDWDPSKSRAGQWDMGHIKDHEYNKLHKRYVDGDISKIEFLKDYRNPKNYMPESVSGNRSRKYEAK
jgi:RHS repeat-associated protein